MTKHPKPYYSIVCTCAALLLYLASSPGWAELAEPTREAPELSDSAHSAQQEAGERLVMIYKEAPAPGALKFGAKILVDDGTCADGQIKQVTGGNVSRGIPRLSECIAHPGISEFVSIPISPLPQTPPPGALIYGAIVFVDDKTCPPSHIKQVVGGASREAFLAKRLVYRGNTW